jgi:hypothetical protein
MIYRQNKKDKQNLVDPHINLGKASIKKGLDQRSTGGLPFAWDLQI